MEACDRAAWWSDDCRLGPRTLAANAKLNEPKKTVACATSLSASSGYPVNEIYKCAWDLAETQGYASGLRVNTLCPAVTRHYPRPIVIIDNARSSGWNQYQSTARRCSTFASLKYLERFSCITAKGISVWRCSTAMIHLQSHQPPLAS